VISMKIEDKNSLLEELKELGCVIFAHNPNGSDYRCRYCANSCYTNEDHRIDHDSDCLWLKINKI
jgi:hypothetical protein